MSKRQATSVLTHDNWDQEDPDEEAGSFEVAAKDVLQQRQIRVAKRRLGSAEQPAKTSSFAGFGGFGLKVKPDDKKPSLGFSLLPSSMFSNGSTSNATSGAMSNSSKSITFGLPTASATSATTGASSLPTPTSASSNQKKEYLEKLKVLNEELLTWLTTEVKRNPFCVLTPVFEDYKRHLTDIQKENSGSSHVNTVGKEEPATKQPPFGFFSQSIAAKRAEEQKPSLSESLQPQAPPPPKSDGAAEQAQDSDDETPPKVEVVEVKEENCVHKIRCKLFYKKDKTFQDKGVGTLYIKQTSPGKSQLLVRADTSLGTILLNIALSPGLPIQKSGKNNVMIVCVPNPPLDPKAEPVPTPMLIRVKTEADADELLEKLNEITS